MPPADIHLNDWMRIFFGIVPWTYFLELFLRAAFFYLVLIVSIRMMGKKMAAQLGRNEVASLVALSASIGIPLTAPDKGIIPGVISCAIIIVGEWLVSFILSRNKKLEILTEGNTTELIVDGVIMTDALKAVSLSRERLLSQVRSYGFRQLGRVKRLYFEENGTFTLVDDPMQKTGLNILPQEDQQYKSSQLEITGSLICDNCGKPKEHVDTHCSNCGHANFIHPVFI